MMIHELSVDEVKSVKPQPLQVSSNDDVDVISRCIRNGVKEKCVGIIAVVAAAIVMASISVLLIIRYVPSVENSNSAAGQQQCMTIIMASRFFSSTVSPFPLWADLLAHQIQIIKNLVHASLLGGAGFVAAYRGDAVWLFFCRNCCFYFGLAALSSLSVVWVNAPQNHDVETFVFSMFLALFCIIGFIRLERIRVRVMGLVDRYVQGHDANYPKFLPSTRSQVVKTTIIARLVDGLQCATVLYTVLTTAEAVVDERCNSVTHVGLLEMSYSQGAHQAFLLALLFLVTCFPGDQSCVGGAILCSGWRALLAVCNVIPLVSFRTFTNREMASLFASSVELVLMLPVLIIALFLYRENASSTMWNSSYRAVKYSQIEEKEEDDDEHSRSDSDDDSDVAALDHVRQILSLSMQQIFQSNHFSPRQRRGAFLVWIFSGSLFMGMTLECLMLLQYGSVVQGMSGEVYQWGMHVCAMYLFCTVMSVNSPEVYSRARWLLIIACPFGSAIACWQLWVVFKTVDGNHLDGQAMIAMALFIVRALSGIGQCLGLVFLSTTEPESALIVSSTDFSVELERRLKGASTILWYLFIPCLLLFVISEALSATCGEPLLSPSTPGCLHEFYLLAMSWPGLGTFFHFGVLLVIFASDSLLNASYPPSLAIASLFAGHVSILLAGRTVIVVFVDGSSKQWYQLVPMVVWMIASVFLWNSLRRLWKWRMLAS